MYHEFTISSQAPIYDPEEFKAFCISAGATTIFDTVLAAMTSERHSEDRIKTNQQRTVAILYTLCFGLSQVCNWLQTDNAIFLHQSNLNQHGLDTVRQMGGSCCRRLAGNLLNHLSNSNHQKISELIKWCYPTSMATCPCDWWLHFHPHQTQTYNRQTVSVKINVHHNYQGL